MAVTAAFYDAVKENNLLRVHIMMKDSLLLDRTFKEFESREMAASTMQGLYVPYDGGELKENPADWDDDYMNTMLVQLLHNFSRERVEHLKRIITYLHPVQTNATENKPNHISRERTKETSYQKQKRLDQENGRIIEKKWFQGGIAVCAGAAAGWGINALAGAVAGASISTGAAILIGAGAAGTTFVIIQCKNSRKGK